jgi:hypothetical protein
MLLEENGKAQNSIQDINAVMLKTTALSRYNGNQNIIASTKCVVPQKR